MINNVSLVGRLTRDPELRKTQTGKSVTSFSIGVNRKFKQEGQPEADFIRITTWGASADFVARYLNKGDQVGIEGRIETGSYQDKDGKTVYTTEVVANSVQSLESKKEKENRLASQGSTYQHQGQQYSNQQYDNEPEEEFGGPTLDITSDDLPF